MPTGRKLHNASKLARLINKDGRPAYKVAAHAGLQPYQLSEYTSLKREIPTKHLHRLCIALGCDPEDILEGVVSDRGVEQR